LKYCIGLKNFVNNVYEIHRYQCDQFQYVVARTNKHSETKVRDDVERMNSMLSEEFKSEGIKYIFSVGTMAEFMKSVSKRQKERSRSEKGILHG
jgi:hypothetical protein